MGTVTIFQTYQIGIVVSNVGSQSKLVMTCPQAIFGEINAQNSVGKSHRSLDVLTDFRVKVHIMAGHPCVGIDAGEASFIERRGSTKLHVLLLVEPKNSVVFVDIDNGKRFGISRSFDLEEVVPGFIGRYLGHKSGIDAGISHAGCQN